jgi:hypothetical protein
VTEGRSAFELRGVAHLIRPWGRTATDLDQLRHGIAEAPADVIFLHAVQYPLRHPAAESLPPDDFGAWIGGVLQDTETAERLSFAVQGGNPSAEPLRAAMLEVLDSIPEARRRRRDAPEDGAFQFRSATAVTFPTGVTVRDGSELYEALMIADAGVWFHHLVEEPWRLANRAPLLEWLAASDGERLAAWLAEAAGAGLPIDKARARVRRRWKRSGIGARLAAAASVPERDRREAGRQALARLLRRRSAAEPR